MTKEWADVIGSLGWPVTALLIFVLFEQPLKSLLAELTQFIKDVAILKTGGVHIERKTQQVLAQVIDAVETSGKLEAEIPAFIRREDDKPQKDTAPTPTAATSNDATDIRSGTQSIRVYSNHRSQSPVEVVLQSWAQFEKEVKRVLNLRGYTPDQMKDWLRLLPSFVDDEYMSLVKEQRNLRNSVAHGGEVTPAAAENYERTAEILTRVIRVSSVTAPVQK